MNSIFNKYKKNDFVELMDQCSRYIDFKGQENKICQDAIEMVNYHKGKKDVVIKKSNLVYVLENRWYQSIQNNEPDYSVYSEPCYLADLWACWVVYSRTGIKALTNPVSKVNMSVVEYIGDIGTVVDVGCGLGYTTSFLKEIFPNANVMGTNIESSYQYKVAKNLGKNRGFNMKPGFKEVGKVDLVFASEYFEHFINPIEHAHELLKNTRPKFVITANGFNGHSTGHFNNYKHGGKWYDNKTMSKMFNKAMSVMGYQRVQTKIWNSRPAVWKKQKYKFKI